VVLLAADSAGDSDLVILPGTKQFVNGNEASFYQQQVEGFSKRMREGDDASDGFVGPKGFKPSYSLNNTQIAEDLSKSEVVLGVFPRWAGFGTIRPVESMGIVDADLQESRFFLFAGVSTPHSLELKARAQLGHRKRLP